MQNGQTEPKLYVYTTQALFVHSKKNKKRKAQRLFFIRNLTIPQLLRDSSLYIREREPLDSDYYLLFLFAVGAFFTFRINTFRPYPDS